MFSVPISIEDYQKLFKNKGNTLEIEKGYNFCQELNEKNIPYFTCITHPEVISSLDSQMYYSNYTPLFGMDYSICKHLFVHERKGLKRHFLIVVDNDKDVDLKSLSLELDLGKLEFCSNDELSNYLNTYSGNVSLFNTKYDNNNEVKILLDKELLDRDLLAFHPLYNGMSIFMPYSSVDLYLNSINKKANIIKVPAKNDENSKYVKTL